MLIKRLVAVVKAKLEEDRIPSYLEFKADPEKYIQYYIQKHQDDQR